MTDSQLFSALGTALFLLVLLCFIARAILRPRREPASRVAWVVVLIVLPLIGMIAYVLLGETSIGRRRKERMRAVLARMPDLLQAPGAKAPNLQPELPDRYLPIF